MFVLWHPFETEGMKDDDYGLYRFEKLWREKRKKLQSEYPISKFMDVNLLKLNWQTFR